MGRGMCSERPNRPNRMQIVRPDDRGPSDGIQSPKRTRIKETMATTNLKRHIPRDRRRRRHRCLAFLVLGGCIIIGAGALCITQTYTSLSLSHLFHASAAVNNAIQPPTMEN